MPRLSASCIALMVSSAIRITGEVGLTHAGNDIFDAAPIGDSAGEAQKDEIAARHKGRRQAGLGNFDRGVTGQCGIRDGGKSIDPHDMIFAETGAPGCRYSRQLVADAWAYAE